MGRSNKVRHYLYSTPPTTSSSSMAPPTVPSSSSSIKSTDSSRTGHRKEAHRLYESEELPSIYDIRSLAPTFTEVPLDNNKVEHANPTHNIVDWEGDEDRANPLNWPTWKKALNIGCIFLMCIISPFTSSVIAPAIPDIMLGFNSRDAYLSAFVLSVYVLGYAVGPLLISPLSELYGRVPLYHLCNVIFSVFTAFCGRTNDLKTLAILRFFAGVGGSSVFALAPSSLADMVSKEKRGAVMALTAVGYNLGPAISPTVGSYINAAKDWRWIFYLTGVLGAGASLLSVFFLSETYEPVLLQRKTRHLRGETHNHDLRSKLDVDDGKSKKQMLRKAMFMPLRMLFSSPAILLISLLTAVGYGFLYILYTTLSTTFLVTYSWEPKRVGLAYLGTAAGNLIGMVVGGGLSDVIIKRRAAKGDTRPENRLIPMIIFWPLVSIGLFIYAWTAHYAVHWIGPMIGTAVFGAGAMSSILFTGAYVGDAYPTHSASAIAASSVLRSLVGGLAPLFANKLYHRYNVGWSFSLFAFIALILAPVPWVFYRHGEVWRKGENLGGVDSQDDGVRTEGLPREP